MAHEAAHLRPSADHPGTYGTAAPRRRRPHHLTLVHDARHHNDNAAPRTPYVYSPTAEAGGLVERVFLLKFWGTRLHRLVGTLSGRGLLP